MLLYQFRNIVIVCLLSFLIFYGGFCVDCRCERFEKSWPARILSLIDKLPLEQLILVKQNCLGTLLILENPDSNFSALASLSIQVISSQLTVTESTKNSSTMENQIGEIPDEERLWRFLIYGREDGSYFVNKQQTNVVSHFSQHSRSIDRYFTDF